jgi:hypothetical protein
MIVQSNRSRRGPGRLTRDGQVQPRHDQFLVAIVDHRRLRLVSTHAREVIEVETLDEPLPRHVETSTGRSRADRHYEELTRMHFRRSSSFIAGAAVHHPGASIVVAGPDDSVAELVNEFDDTTSARVAGRVSLAMTAGILDIIAALEPLRDDLERRYVDDLVTALVEGGNAKQRAVSGLSATLESLADRCVSHLVVTASYASEGAQCPACGHLDVAIGTCNRCGEQQTSVEDVVALAIDRSIELDAIVDLVEVDEPSRFCGIGAFERF